ncbi:uncharacterized protein [Chelonus insularis]|uniref:uncharacterized protein n=1 Tax=Chelonus insularis TaxID=460826 RepID=UPI00158A7283|nr:uncharacterized protein LOC118064471 [Chelonus insularis]
MIKSLGLLINIIFLTSFVLAEVPSYLHVCGRRDPDLDNCILKSVDAVRAKLLEGIPELDVPPLEPLLLPEGLPLANAVDLKASAKNVKLWNATTFSASDFHADLEKKQFSYKLHFDSLKVEGDYEIDAKVLIPIHGVGFIDIDTSDINADIFLGYKLINTKKGQQLYFTTMSCKIKIGDYKCEFRAVDTPSATLSDAINSVINSNRQEILESIIPVLEKAISRKVLEIANSICKNFTYDELFPDRE